LRFAANSIFKLLETLKKALTKQRIMFYHDGALNACVFSAGSGKDDVDIKNKDGKEKKRNGKE